jgi:hypothetical protein
MARIAAFLLCLSLFAAPVRLASEPSGGAPICGTPRPVAGPSAAAKRGFGEVAFVNSCSPAAQPALQTAIARLHSFDVGIDSFRAIAAQHPSCAMAWWGGAMAARGNPLAGEPARASLQAGRKLLDRAKAVRNATPRERAIVEALDVYFRDYPGGHGARTQAYEAAMESVYGQYPSDIEIGAFYALAILEAVDLTDKTYARQLKAGSVLEPIFAAHPDHPGAPHYLIHAYDYPPLAMRGLAAARRESDIAPAAAHAQHMPSHIYTMLGLWDQSIEANARAARILDPRNAGNAVASDIEDPHGFDFIVYARLQEAQDDQVAADLASLRKKNQSFATVEARFALERRDWIAASSLRISSDPFDATVARFARAYGAARLGNVAAAETELKALRTLREPMRRTEGDYWAGFVDVYAGTAQAWIEQASGRTDTAIATMQAAAMLDDSREKHISLENKLLPMREVLGELLLETGRPQQAADAFAQSLQTSPNRYRSFAGAAKAARATGNDQQARNWYAKLLQLTERGNRNRPELAEAREFMQP